MKNSLILNWGVLACLGLTLSFCTQIEEPLKNGAEQASPEIVFQDCSDACKYADRKTFEISKECADCMMANYKANGFKFNLLNDPSSDVLRGFGLEAYEVLEIALKIEKNPGAQVFSMLGIYHGTGIQPNPKDTITKPEMIMVVNYPSKGGADDEEDDYYNFTQPCPNFCPEG